MFQGALRPSSDTLSGLRNEREEARSELSRLGLVSVDIDEARGRGFTSDRNAELEFRWRRRPAGRRGLSLSKPLSTFTRVALVLVAVTIASLAVAFG